MSQRSPRVPITQARAELAKANAKRATRNQSPLVMNAQGEVVLSNGAVAAYVEKNGVPRFQIVANPTATGVGNQKMADLQARRKLSKTATMGRDGKMHRSREYVDLSPQQAENAWRRGFAHKSYKSEATRKRAMSRNKCSPCLDRNMAPNARFLNNPTKLCYPGVNDGNAPECADRKAKYANPSPKQLDGRRRSAEALAVWQRKHTEQGADGKRHLTANSRRKNGPGSNETNSVSKPYKPRSKKAQAGGSHEEEEEEQHGGRAVSLKTAVRLLRQYYNSKYN
jgi:hypothetical protein